ncbi:ubiquitin carboxyl-terminal hydrolase CYLD isoform X3, partial [Paramuricea clavata]
MEHIKERDSSNVKLILASLYQLRLCEDQIETKNESKTDTKEVNITDESNSGVFTKVKKFAEGLSNFVLLEQSQEENLQFYPSEKQDKNNAGHEIDDKVWIYINDKLYGGHIKYIGQIPGGRETYAGIRLDHDVGKGDGEYYALRNNPPTLPQMSEDILNMESKFSKQSEDEVTKNQEYKERKNLEKSRAGIGTSFNEQWKESKNENESKRKENEKKRPTGYQKDEYSYTFYILLRGRLAKKQDKCYSYSRADSKYLLEGEILIRNLTTVVDSTNGTLRLHPYGKATYFCDCPLEEIKPLEDEEAKLLLSFKSNDERIKFYINSNLDSGKKMTIGSNVYVKIRSVGGGMQELRGVIRYKGPLPEEHGTMFGVELLEGKGRGITDGLFKGKRYFKCESECGVFVSLEKLRLCDATDESLFVKVKNKIVEGISNGFMSPVEQANEEAVSEKQDKSMGHKQHDRVWVFINDKPFAGFIRYIGRVPGYYGIFAGIEMDNAVGIGNGEFYGKQLLTCPMDHAHFTLIKNVLSELEFQELYGQPKDATVASGPCPRNPTSTNHHQMANTRIQSNLEFGSMVEVSSKNQTPRYGKIRWLGFVPNSDKKIAGLELEEEMDSCTDGTFLGKRYFTCPNKRGFFVHLHNCLPDSRFPRNFVENHADKRLSGTDFGSYYSPIIEDVFIPAPEKLNVYLKQGKNAQGIQGHHGSCYLDATLFAAFAFSSVMDSILLRPKHEKDIDDYEKVQTVLRNNIVYPLRSHGFVRADRVLELRQLLDKLGTVTGLVGEEKDPGEFLTTLLHQVLKSEPFLKI